MSSPQQRESFLTLVDKLACVFFHCYISTSGMRTRGTEVRGVDLILLEAMLLLIFLFFLYNTLFKWGSSSSIGQWVDRIFFYIWRGIGKSCMWSGFRRLICTEASSVVAVVIKGLFCQRSRIIFIQKFLGKEQTMAVVMSLVQFFRKRQNCVGC